jgi:uncharacterized membrane protein YhhN
MKKNFWFGLYFLLWMADLAALYTTHEWLRYITKGLLMPALLVYFLSASSTHHKWIVSALLFSWAGDVLLLFEAVHTNYFIFGLTAFLLAHIFYILFFEKIIRQERRKKKYVFLLPVSLYYGGLMYLLLPHLGSMKVPVLLYGIVICYMLLQALQLAGIKNRQAATAIIAGAVFFVISDSLLALDKFYHPFAFSGILVMMTYGVAQFFLIAGAVKYPSTDTKQ